LSHFVLPSFPTEETEKDKLPKIEEKMLLFYLLLVGIVSFKRQRKT
jgi:hypothetical protein